MITNLSTINYNNKLKPQNNTTYFKGNQKTVDIRGTQTCAKVYTDNINYQTYEQIKSICSHPALKDAPVRVMPDTHAGKTAVVGFTVPVDVNQGIIPSLISGDIGCGMLCIELDTKGKDIDYEKLDNVIKTYVSDRRKETPPNLYKKTKQINKEIDTLYGEYKLSSEKALSKMGTLGSGNHFIEIDTDKNNNKYLVIHTGSRSFGKDIYNHHQKIAQEQNPYKNRELSYLTGDEAKEYLNDMRIGIKYSQLNRRIIADEIMKRMDWKEKSSFESIHNYISDDGYLRKGAISSKNGEKVLIPLNKKDGAIIAIGKGNSDWNFSAPHGAGRQFSRAEAAELLDYNDYIKDMNGIYTSCVSESTLDESPQAYKDPKEIIDNIEDTANIQEIIKPIFNYKD